MNKKEKDWTFLTEEEYTEDNYETTSFIAAKNDTLKLCKINIKMKTGFRKYLNRWTESCTSGARAGQEI